LKRFSQNALRDENDKTNPRASVLLYDSFEGIPPCLFIVAELDPIRDDSYRKIEKIKSFTLNFHFVFVSLSKETRSSWY